MKVRAIAKGTYGGYRNIGDEFVLADEDHLGSWMEPVSEVDRKRFAAKLQQLRRYHRHPAGPDVPATPALLKDRIMPRAGRGRPAETPNPDAPPARVASLVPPTSAPVDPQAEKPEKPKKPEK